MNTDELNPIQTMDGYAKIRIEKHDQLIAEFNQQARTIAAQAETIAKLRDTLNKCEIALHYVNFDGEYDGQFAVVPALLAARAALAEVTK